MEVSILFQLIFINYQFLHCALQFHDRESEILDQGVLFNLYTCYTSLHDVCVLHPGDKYTEERSSGSI